MDAKRGTAAQLANRKIKTPKRRFPPPGASGAPTSFNAAAPAVAGFGTPTAVSFGTAPTTPSFGATPNLTFGAAPSPSFGATPQFNFGAAAAAEPTEAAPAAGLFQFGSQPSQSFPPTNGSPAVGSLTPNQSFSGFGSSAFGNAANSSSDGFGNKNSNVGNSGLVNGSFGGFGGSQTALFNSKHASSTMPAAAPTTAISGPASQPSLFKPPSTSFAFTATSTSSNPFSNISSSTSQPSASVGFNPPTSTSSLFSSQFASSNPIAFTSQSGNSATTAPKFPAFNPKPSLPPTEQSSVGANTFNSPKPSALSTSLGTSLFSPKRSRPTEKSSESTSLFPPKPTLPSEQSSLATSVFSPKPALPSTSQGASLFSPKPTTPSSPGTSLFSSKPSLPPEKSSLSTSLFSPKPSLPPSSQGTSLFPAKPTLPSEQPQGTGLFSFAQGQASSSTPSKSPQLGIVDSNPFSRLRSPEKTPEPPQLDFAPPASEPLFTFATPTSHPSTPTLPGIDGSKPSDEAPVQKSSNEKASEPKTPREKTSDGKTSPEKSPVKSADETSDSKAPFPQIAKANSPDMSYLLQGFLPNQRPMFHIWEEAQATAKPRTGPNFAYRNPPALPQPWDFDYMPYEKTMPTYMTGYRSPYMTREREEQFLSLKGLQADGAVKALSAFEKALLHQDLRIQRLNRWMQSEVPRAVKIDPSAVARLSSIYLHANEIIMMEFYEATLFPVPVGPGLFYYWEDGPYLPAKGGLCLLDDNGKFRLKPGHAPVVGYHDVHAYSSQDAPPVARKTKSADELTPAAKRKAPDAEDLRMAERQEVNLFQRGRELQESKKRKAAADDGGDAAAQTNGPAKRSRGPSPPPSPRPAPPRRSPPLSPRAVRPSPVASIEALVAEAPVVDATPLQLFRPVEAAPAVQNAGAAHYSGAQLFAGQPSAAPTESDKSDTMGADGPDFRPPQIDVQVQSASPPPPGASPAPTGGNVSPTGSVLNGPRPAGPNIFGHLSDAGSVQDDDGETGGPDGAEAADAGASNGPSRSLFDRIERPASAPFAPSPWFGTPQSSASPAPAGFQFSFAGTPTTASQPSFVGQRTLGAGSGGGQFAFALTPTPSADTSRGSSPSAVNESSGGGNGGGGVALDEPTEPQAKTPDEAAFDAMADTHEFLFRHERAKAMRFEEDTKDERGGAPWAAKGVGPVALVRHKDSGVVSVLMRAKPSGAVVLNTRLVPTVEYKTMGPKRVRIVVPVDGGRPETWLLVFKEHADAIAMAMRCEANKS